MEATYKIIGGDGAEYGPATLDELREWIRDGRVAGKTQVWRSDAAGWSPAARYAELASDLARLDASTAAAARPCGFWARLGAHIIDSLVLGALFQLVWSQLTLSHDWPLPPLPTVLNDETVKQFVQDCQIWANHAIVVYYPICLVYDMLMNGRFGATLGKMAIGARIVMLDGSHIGYGRAAIRGIASVAIELFCLPANVIIGLRRDKRALHDFVAGTRVIYKS